MAKKLTPKANRAYKAFSASLKTKKRRTSKPVVVAMAGLPGSGKSMAAKVIAGKIGAVVIEGDVIRVELRKVGERFEQTRPIILHAMRNVLKTGGNIVLDGDWVTADERNDLKAALKGMDARLVFVRTHTDRDVMIERIIRAKYPRAGFFKSSTVKIREMWRRTPNHYHWENKSGGIWAPKKLPFVSAEIDTTDSKKWRKEIDRLTKSIK